MTLDPLKRMTDRTFNGPINIRLPRSACQGGELKTLSLGATLFQRVFPATLCPLLCTPYSLAFIMYSYTHLNLLLPTTRLTANQNVMAFVQLKSTNWGRKLTDWFVIRRRTFICIHNTHTNTHTHTFTGICMYICKCVSVCLSTCHLFGTSLRAITVGGYFRFVAPFEMQEVP